MQLVSIIMPVYNSSPYLNKAIESILNQTYQNFEFLIIDDYSTDNSLEIINSYNDNRIIKLKNDKNLGSLISRNKLFELTKGDIITFQDADDFSNPDRIEKIVECFNKNKEYKIIGSNVNYFSNTYNYLNTSNKPIEYPEIVIQLNNSIPIVFATSAIRRSILNEVGVFRDYFKDLGNYDYDWIYRILENNKGLNIEESLYNVTIHTNSNSKTILNPKKLIGDKIVRFLANERKTNNGIDSLSKKDKTKLIEFENKELQKYIDDPSKIYFERTEAYLSLNNFKNAFKNAVLCFYKKPLHLKNVRTIFYVVRKYLKFRLLKKL